MVEQKKTPKIMLVRVEELSTSTIQPRTKFNQESLAELAQSIAVHGVLQPLIIRQGGLNKYEIVAGERRFRAAKLAGIKRLPCIMMNILNDKALAIALVENIQREDLNPIEEALAYFKLKETMKMTQEAVAAKVGKDRASIANTIRLLRLPKVVQDMVVNEDLSMGHARALLSLDTVDMMSMVARKIIREGLSVRRTESIIRAIKGGGNSFDLKKLKDGSVEQDAIHKEVQQKLEHALGTKVLLKKENKGYSMVVHFADSGQLNGILDILGVEI
jgi:ParB family transcriptional regulator, chromosome partitioning protein